MAATLDVNPRIICKKRSRTILSLMLYKSEGPSKARQRRNSLL